MSRSYTVLVPIHFKTKSRLLKKCLDSILNQTEVPFEIIVIKDGQISDNCLHLLNFYFKYKTIKLISLSHNMGLSVALNTALQNCRTEFVLRIDSDDFASPTRAIEQINFLRNNPSIAVVSSYAIEFDGYRKTKTYRKGPISNQNILMESKLRNPILHPTVMFRKSAILNVGGYPEIKYAQDYALWGILMTNNFNFACIPKYLTSINQDSNFYKRRGFKYFISEYYVLQFLKSISFLDHKQYYFQLFFRFFSRISPFFVRSWIYKFVRFLVLKS